MSIEKRGRGRTSVPWPIIFPHSSTLFSQYLVSLSGTRAKRYDERANRTLSTACVHIFAQSESESREYKLSTRYDIAAM